MDRGHVRKRAVGLCAAAAAAAMAGVLPAAASTGGGGSFIGGLNTVKTVSSTIPANGDVNPYGVAIVPKSHGDLTAGDVLVSNFNNGPPVSPGTSRAAAPRSSKSPPVATRGCSPRSRRAVPGGSG